MRKTESKESEESFYACSAQECTGLIPALPRDREEQESFPAGSRGYTPQRFKKLICKNPLRAGRYLRLPAGDFFVNRQGSLRYRPLPRGQI